MNGKFLSIFVVCLIAQFQLKAQTELEIKTTGKFLYSWSIENTRDSAIASARSGLLDSLFVNASGVNAFNKADSVYIDVIEYFVNKVGFKWQAIAFVKKSDIKIAIDQRKKIKVIPVIIGSGDKTAPQTVDYPIIHPSEDSVQAVRSQEEVVKEFSSSDAILGDLMKCPDATALEQKLTRYRAELKLNFGDKSNYPDPSGCYIFVVDHKTLKVIAVYDKGKENRMELLSKTADQPVAERIRDNYAVYVVIN